MPSVVGSWNSSYLWGINTILFIFWAPQPFHYWFAVRWPIHSTLVPLCAYLIHQHACYILKKMVSWYLISHGNRLCVNLVCTASLCSTHQNLVKCNHTSCADEGISVFVLFNGYTVFPFWRMAHCISVVKICPVILLQWYTTQPITWNAGQNLVCWTTLPSASKCFISDLQLSGIYGRVSSVTISLIKELI